MHNYIALIHKDETSDYGVSFPDLPGCITAGRTVEEARAFAKEALALHLARLAEDGEPVLKPSSLHRIREDGANHGALAVLS